MRIAILGAPGSGKGTQAELLATRYRVPRISVGGLLRAAAADDDKLDGKTREAVAAGKPVADETVLGLLGARLRARDSKRGFIIDAFPGNIPQAQALDALLGMLGWALQISVHIKADDETLVRSITGRLRCGQCGAVYNRHSSPPQSRGKCDNCGGGVVSGGRGNAKAAARRVGEYHELTAPLLAYYKAQHKLRTVVADGDAEQTRQKICDIVDLEIRPLEIQTLKTAAQTHHEEISTVIAGGQISRIASAPEATAKSGRTTTVSGAKAPPARTTGAAIVKKKTTGKKVAKKTTKKTPAKTAVKKKTPAKRPAVKASAKKTAKKPAPTKNRSRKTGKKSTTRNPAKKKTAKRKTAKKK